MVRHRNGKNGQRHWTSASPRQHVEKALVLNKTQVLESAWFAYRKLDIQRLPN